MTQDPQKIFLILFNLRRTYLNKKNVHPSYCRHFNHACSLQFPFFILYFHITCIVWQSICCHNTLANIKGLFFAVYIVCATKNIIKHNTVMRLEVSIMLKISTQIGYISIYSSPQSSLQHNSLPQNYPQHRSQYGTHLIILLSASFGLWGY